MAPGETQRCAPLLPRSASALFGAAWLENPDDPWVAMGSEIGCSLVAATRLEPVKKKGLPDR